MSKTQGNFKLNVVEGEFTDSQIVVMLGENGTGKTTFIRMLVMPHTFFMFKNLLLLLISYTIEMDIFLLPTIVKLGASEC
jgi:Fe-S cluster assembly ATPase SufC